MSINFSTLGSELDKLSEVIKISNVNKELEKQIEYYRQKITTCENEIKNLLQQLKDEQEKSQVINQELKIKTEELFLVVEKQTNDSVAYSAEVTELSQKIKLLEEENKLLIQNLHTTQERLEDNLELENQINQYKQQLNDYENENNKLQQNLKHEQDNSKVIQQQLNTITAELSKSTEKQENKSALVNTNELSHKIKLLEDENKLLIQQLHLTQEKFEDYIVNNKGDNKYKQLYDETKHKLDSANQKYRVVTTNEMKLKEQVKSIKELLNSRVSVINAKSIVNKIKKLLG